MQMGGVVTQTEDVASISVVYTSAIINSMAVFDLLFLERRNPSLMATLDNEMRVQFPEPWLLGGINERHSTPAGDGEWAVATIVTHASECPVSLFRRQRS